MKWLRHAFSRSCFLIFYFFNTCYYPLIIRINPTDGRTESTLQGNINEALVTDETNDDGICMNTRDEISQCGLPAKDDLGSEAEKQKHSEIRSSLGDQISLCELPGTLTEGSESDGQIKNQRKQNQSVKSNVYVWSCRKSDGLWTCFDAAFTQKKKFRQALFFYTAKVSLSCTDIESRHAQKYSGILTSNPRTGQSQPRQTTIRNKNAFVDNVVN